ncbi:BCCT family transporter [Ligilactobacillus saerimneri]|uniref:Choline/carnitine/betaine transporter n=1 Tax=Ligilactobacillus saerimneri 30a TaxID=1227363 RepID=M5J5Y3_9LACO|nr:BCCT family transporter [Ligilactobacillus saerimneri]EKW98850.1 choline/carnitine/betaine transporter [Ligilactobacillus saerimneri 30a]
MKNSFAKRIDWIQTLVPLGSVATLVTIFLLYPQKSTYFLQSLRVSVGEHFGWYYILLGMGIFITTLIIAFSRYGEIRLGNDSKPKYSNIQWGMMIFTSTMSADIIFYALTEWTMYAREHFIQQKSGGLGVWTLSYSLFHWGPIAWSFYIVLAVAFAFMIHVRQKNRQKFSEAVRPLLGQKTDGLIGKLINLVAIFALIAGTATTFSISMPLLSAALSKILGITDSVYLSVGVLLAIALVYTVNVLLGMKAISRLSSYCVILFLILIGYFFFAGGKEIYILDNGVAALGNLVQNFIGMATWTDPLRQSNFVQNWTIYYWSYWLVWCTATPFFIATISKGRTIKNLILGAYGWGLSGTALAFVTLSNYGLGKYLQDGLVIYKLIDKGNSYVEIAMKVLETLPFHNVILLILILTMMGMYATVFESITMVVSTYSYKELKVDELPDRKIRAFWAITFIILPITLLFMKQSIYSLQSVAIIFAFPISVVVLMIVTSFFKDGKKYLDELVDR